MSQITTMARQGDVLMIKLKGRAPEMTEEPADPRGLVLAEGETSGHHHQVFGAGHKLFRLRGSDHRLLVVGDGGATVEVVGGGAGGVPRHLPVELAPGNWEIRLQRAWTSDQYSTRVED